MDAFAALAQTISTCARCPRLVQWRAEVAQDPPRRFVGETYWARGVPGFGDPHARIVFVGLAPGAQGANRTGRMFTGDRSGDFLYGSLYRAGLANQPTSESRHDGLVLTDAYVTAAVRCAPPGNKPTPGEREACQPFLEQELELLTQARVFVALGAFGYEALWRAVGQSSELPKPRPGFEHGLEVVTPRGVMLGCYHPSQQNTFTGKLTAAMIDEVVERAKALAG